MPRETVVVFSGTGVQGYTVAYALLTDGKFRVRAVAKTTSNRKALLLRGKGADFASATLDNIEQCKTAVKNAYGVFLVTNYWEHRDVEREFRQGKNVVDACIEAGVKHLVFSGQEHVEKLTGYSCPHFDAKGRLEEYIQKVFPPDRFWTIIRLPFYFNSFLTSCKPTMASDGTREVAIPMEGCPLPGIDVHDVGRCVLTIFHDPETYGNRLMGLAGGIYSIQEYCNIFTRNLAPTQFTDKKLTLSAYSNIPVTGNPEMTSMYKFYQQGLDRSVEITKKLNPKVSDFDTFVKNNKDELAKS